MQKKYDENNIFQKIIRKELPSTIIYEDDKILAFNDINPKAPVHILVVPKKNYISFDDFAEQASNNEISYFFKKVQEIAKNQGLSDKSYRIVGNCGEEAGQIVHHFHIHILGYK
ncbi:MAG: histidine triad nucleotide-binding protein [Rickettsiales bacterium]|nr:histidine triad nucleotide-binding protein [Rickettsiales bacterium]